MDDMTIKAVAEILGCSKQTVRKYLKDFDAGCTYQVNVKNTPTTFLKGETAQAIIDRYKGVHPSNHGSNPPQTGGNSTCNHGGNEVVTPSNPTAIFDRGTGNNYDNFSVTLSSYRLQIDLYQGRIKEMSERISGLNEHIQSQEKQIERLTASLQDALQIAKGLTQGNTAPSGPCEKTPTKRAWWRVWQRAK